MTGPEETTLDDVGSGEGPESAIETLRLMLLDAGKTDSLLSRRPACQDV